MRLHLVSAMIKAMADPLQIDPKDASAKQLMLAVYESQLRMEQMMADLSTAVTDLQNAVDGVAGRLLPKIEQLESANSTLQSQLSQALADDEAAAAAFQEIEDATAAIRSQVDELNSLGADPSTPVTPSDPDAHPDNTLPGDLPHPDNSLPGDQPYPDQGLPGDQPEVNPLGRKKK